MDNPTITMVPVDLWDVVALVRDIDSKSTRTYSIILHILGSARNPGNGSPEPPPPPPRNHDMSNSSFNDSKESNEISEAECDRDHGPRGNYGGKFPIFQSQDEL